MRTSSFLAFACLITLAGCWRGDFDLTDPPRPPRLFDTYGSSENPVRSAYALGAEVVFSPELSEADEGRETRIEIMGDGLTVLRTDGADLVAEASAEGSGTVVFSDDGEEISRHPYEVHATDRVAYRRIHDLFFREELEGVELVVPEGASTEVIVDYYAGDLRLYGRGIASSEDLEVHLSENNDRFFLPTSVVGDQQSELSITGGAISTFEFSVVDHVDAITIRVEDGEEGTLSVLAEARDAEGRLIRAPVEWAIDGVALDIPFELVPFTLDASETVHTLSATLLDATASVEVMADITP